MDQSACLKLAPCVIVHSSVGLLLSQIPGLLLFLLRKKARRLVQAQRESDSHNDSCTLIRLFLICSFILYISFFFLRPGLAVVSSPFSPLALSPCPRIQRCSYQDTFGCSVISVAFPCELGMFWLWGLPRQAYTQREQARGMKTGGKRRTMALFPCCLPASLPLLSAYMFKGLKVWEQLSRMDGGFVFLPCSEADVNAADRRASC